MKKQILIIFTGAMELGGIERSLIALMDSIDYSSYDVDLFLYGHHGPLFPLINSNVNLLPEVKELAFLRESFGTKMKNGCFYSAALRLRDEVKMRMGKKVIFDETWAHIMRRLVPKISKHYDLALSFFRPFDFISEKVEADIKLGWVHTDYSACKVDMKILLSEYTKLDCIVAVSDACKNSFNKVLPQFSERVIVIENQLSEVFIRAQAEEKIPDCEMDNSVIKILSVGRFCEAKNFDHVPEICKKIRQYGCNVKWYLIGYGADESLIRSKIKNAGMEEYVIILGKKINPYPYMKACDLYVQPSRYEGKAVTVREAQILHKPVIISNYATAQSQLTNGYDGVIVPMDDDGCAKGIISVIENSELRKQLIKNTSKEDYTNKDELEKLYRLMR